MGRGRKEEGETNMEEPSHLSVNLSVYREREERRGEEENKKRERDERNEMKREVSRAKKVK